MTQVARDIQILISHPFCLPYGNAPVNRYRRREVISNLKDALGDDWYVWDVDGTLPAVMKKRKDVLLVHSGIDNEDMFNRAVQLNKKYENLRTVVSVKHSCYLWDYGLLAVDVTITLRLNSQDALLSIYPFAEAFEEEMLTNDMYLPPGMKSWAEVQNVFLNAFAKAGIPIMHWLTSPSAPTFLLETCCWNLIIVQDKTAGLFASKEILDQCLEEFCGTNTSPETFDTGVIEFYASHTGYSGNVSIVINEEEADRVRWLYKVVAILYSALMECAEPCYDLVTALIEEQGSTSKSVADIRLIQKVIDLLHAEANPIVICSESFDAQIYDKVWNCWGGNEIDALIDQRTTFLMHTLSDLSEQKTQNLQMRLNFVVFVLTLVSIASTIASIIDLLDVSDNSEAESRALILGIITGIIGLLCAIVVTFDVSRWVANCRRSSEAVVKHCGALAKPRKSASVQRSFRAREKELHVKVIGDG